MNTENKKIKRRPLLAKRSRGDIGLLEITEAIEHYVAHGDWSRLGVLLQTVGSNDAAIIREITERCLLGSSFQRSTRNAFGWSLKISPGIGRVITPSLNLCKKLGADGFSFRSQRVADALFLTRGVKDEYDLNRALKSLIVRAERAGKSKEILDELETCRRRIFRLDI